MKSNSKRIIVAGMALFVAIVIITALVYTMRSGSFLGMLLIDKRSESITANSFFSVQSLMWISFCIGVGELLIRLSWGKKEKSALTQDLLPIREDVMLRSADLPPIYKKTNTSADNIFLPRMIKRVIRQFQISKSVDQSNSILNSSLELYLHEVDLRYNMLRYLVWVVPTLGFIGTVMGIADGLEIAAEQYQTNAANIDLALITQALGVAFHTTLLSLIMSGILVFFMQIAQGNEEDSLNQSGQYCLDHLINKLYEG